MEHVGHHVVQYPLVSDARCLIHLISHNATLAKCRSYLCIHKGNCYISIGVVLVESILPAAAKITIILELKIQAVSAMIDFIETR